MKTLQIPKVSVITVVYNDYKHICATLDSFFNQSWQNKELIVIDGGSTDGTADIIRNHGAAIAYWCSEPDDGIYDAMNKGIQKATGDWICFLNSGDIFTTPTSIEDSMLATDLSDVDVIYGNSVEVTSTAHRHLLAGEDIESMKYHPIYRHGSSFVRTETQRRFMFDVSLRDKLGYALDWEMIYRMYKSGCRFRKVDVFVQSFLLEGVSNHPLRNRWYNYLITSRNRWSVRFVLYFLYNCILHLLVTSSLYTWIKAFFMEYMVNDILPHIPFWLLRKSYLRMLRAKIGRGSFIMKKSYIQSPHRLCVGEYSHINRGCILDARGNITRGNNVSISHRACLMTGGHDHRSASFVGVFKPIVIEDYAWLGVNSVVLQGVTIGKGAVVCSGAVVTHDVCEYDIVAGVPARVIGKRPSELDYHCLWDMPFT